MWRFSLRSREEEEAAEVLPGSSQAFQRHSCMLALTYMSSFVSASSISPRTSSISPRASSISPRASSLAPHPPALPELRTSSGSALTELPRRLGERVVGEETAPPLMD